MTLEDFNDLPEAEAIETLMRCCGAHRWVNKLVHHRPFRDPADLYSCADEIWEHMGREDILEAFKHHPQIGDLDSLRKKYQGGSAPPYAATANWAEGEQSGTASASEEVLQGLAEGNQAYLEKFGYIFIICATGKSAAQMLEQLELRLKNDPAHELQVAAAEQGQITRLRLEKLLAS